MSWWLLALQGQEESRVWRMELKSAPENTKIQLRRVTVPSDLKWRIVFPFVGDSNFRISDAYLKFSSHWS